MFSLPVSFVASSLPVSFVASWGVGTALVSLIRDKRNSFFGCLDFSDLTGAA